MGSRLAVFADLVDVVSGHVETCLVARLGDPAGRTRRLMRDQQPKRCDCQARNTSRHPDDGATSADGHGALTS